MVSANHVPKFRKIISFWLTDSTTSFRIVADARPQISLAELPRVATKTVINLRKPYVERRVDLAQPPPPLPLQCNSEQNAISIHFLLAIKFKLKSLKKCNVPVNDHASRNFHPLFLNKITHVFSKPRRISVLNGQINYVSYKQV